jgi:hypothetical protein
MIPKSLEIVKKANLTPPFPLKKHLELNLEITFDVDLAPGHALV